MVKVTEVEVNATSREKRQRWRHVSSPSVATVHPVSSGGHDCIEMKSVSIRTRAMSTCEQAASSTVRCHMHSSRQASLPVAASPTDAPLYNETSLKYLENQLSPESLLMEDNSSGDCSSKEADNEDWLMSDFMAGITGSKSPSSPPPQTGSPEPTSLSPLALYPTSDMCDVLTRTKNPVLPSVYIDNSSLIVPEPSKQKYHATTSLSLTVGDDDLDYYAEAFMDDKDSMFPV